MHRSFFYFIYSALAFIAPTFLRAEVADEAVEALLNLRKQDGYSWEVSTAKGGVNNLSQLPRTKHGSINAAGEIYLEQVWPDGLVLETVVRRDGAVVHTPDGWYTKSELSNFSRQTKRGTPQSPWFRYALNAFEITTPEEELTRMLNDAKDYARVGDKIEALLTERGATYWLGSTRLIPNATGHVSIRLRNGLIRECRISAEGEMPNGPTGNTKHVEFEIAFIFDYTGGSFAVPYEAKQKLRQVAEDK